MLDYRLTWPGVIQERNGSNGNGDLDENDDDVDEGNYDGKYSDLFRLPSFTISILDEDAEMTQMWLIPGENEEVDKIYNTMVQCQVLNPDPNDSLSEEGKDNSINIISDKNFSDTSNNYLLFIYIKFAHFPTL